MPGILEELYEKREHPCNYGCGFVARTRYELFLHHKDCDFGLAKERVRMKNEVGSISKEGEGELLSKDPKRGGI